MALASPPLTQMLWASGHRGSIFSALVNLSSLVCKELCSQWLVSEGLALAAHWLAFLIFALETDLQRDL